ncbi:MAG: hypothetical protein ABIF80_04535 [Patescibacteria group bacterium]
MLNKKKYNRIIKISRIVLISIPVIILLFTFNKRFVPFGELSETYKFKKQGAVISGLFPADGVGEIKKDEVTGGRYLEIKGSPIYFYVNLPFSAKYIDLDVSFKESDAPIIQFGVPYKYDGKSQYITDTIGNSFIENLGENVLIGKEDDIVLLRNLQSTTQYEGTMNNEKKDKLADYLSKIPANDTVAFYQVDPINFFRINNYSSGIAKNSIDTILRGSHELVTYIENETLDFSFYFKQRNLSKQIDDVMVKLFRGNELIEEWENSESVNVDHEDFDKMIHIMHNDLETGIYTLEVDTGSNTNIVKISTTQKYMAFKDHLLLDNKEMSSQYYMSNNMVFKTSHSSGLQTVNVDGESIEIEKLNKYFGYTIDSEIAKVVIPKSDILIEYDGIASTELENINNLVHRFNIVDLEDSACSGDLDFDYALSSFYDPQINASDTNGYTKTFNVSDLFVDENGIKFKLNIPCIENYKNVKLNEIKVTLRK